MKLLVSVFILLFIVSAKQSFAQNKKTDSLYQVLKTVGQDTNRVNALRALGWVMLDEKRNNVSALVFFNLSTKLAEEIDYKEGIANGYVSMGVLYDLYQNNYPKALEFYLKDLKIKEESNNEEEMGYCYARLGSVYHSHKQYSKAMEYFLRAIPVLEKKADTSNLSFIYSGVAFDYIKLNNYTKGLEFYFKSLKIDKESKDTIAITADYHDVGYVYFLLENYSKTQEYIYISLSKAKENKDESNIGACYGTLSKLYNKLKKYPQAIAYADSAIALNGKINDLELAMDAHKELAIAYSALSNYKAAFEAHIKYKALTDSINKNYKNENEMFNDLISSYEEEKKDIITQVEKKKQRMILTFISCFFVLASVFGVMMYRRFKITQNQKLIIEQKEIETQKQKHLVEEKQKEILDSITYSKRLQQAIFPPQEFITKHLPNSFVLYKPKDIVAGDFYWAEKVDDLFFIAAADSTGHGVPGALVSVVCSNALNRTIKEFKLTETGKILDKTRELVLETFEKSASEVKDGMDISLLCIDHKNKTIFWSGANNPLWYIQENELKEIKADKQPIGKTEYAKPFTTHEIEYKHNTAFYLFTDGLPDQFGGPKGKKFKYKQFSGLLVNNVNQTPKKQVEIINKAFEDWKGDLEQVDDVCVIGIKL